MTTAAKLLEATHVAGGRLWVTGDGRLGVRAPRRLVDLLRDHKAEVLALLTATVADRVGGGETVVIGPWFPSSDEDVTEHRRRVFEEDPQKWWWKPRCRLAVLERAGVNQTMAVAVVQAELAATEESTISVDERHEAEGPSAGDAE
jgi:hypothetical protein